MKDIKEMLLLLKDIGHYLIDREEKVVLTREQFGETISTNYPDAIEALESNLFNDSLSVADTQMHQVLLALESKYDNSSQILFHLQYELNPNLPFSYKDIVYRDVYSLGTKILVGKAEEETILEAMKLKLISHYARLKQLDNVRSDIIEHIERAENYVRIDPVIALYLLGYYLSDRKFYKYDGRKFLSVVTLYTYLTDKRQLIKFSKTMDSDILFIAWLYSLDKGEIYEKWIKEVEKIDLMDFETFNTPIEETKLFKDFPKRRKIEKE